MSRPVLAFEPEADTVPSGWRTAPLDSLATETRERAGDAHALPVLSVTKHSGIVRAEDYFKKAVHGRDTANYKVVRKGDLAYATIHLDEGSIGVLEHEAAGIVSPMYTVFRPTRAIEARYLFWTLKLPGSLDVYRRLAEGTVNRRASIGFDSLAALHLLHPPLGEQRKIAAILSSVDGAIHATRAVMDQLRVVKKAMMAELLTRGLPGRHTRFKQSKIGEVPEEWEVVPLGQCVREPIRNGYSPVCPSAPTGKWMLHLGAVTFEGFNPGAAKPAPLEDPKVDANLVEVGDLLVSRSNTRDRVGLAGVYMGSPSPCSFPDLLMRVRTLPSLLPKFLEALLLGARAREYLSSSARGTSESMVKINRALLAHLQIQVPSLHEQQEIVSVINGVSAREQTERLYLDGLRAMKSALMSVLLTGEVRVTPDEAPV